MAHLIDKDALVAEIKELQSKLNLDSPFGVGAYTNLSTLLDRVDSLEVKEVDLEKDVRQILSLYYEGIKHYEDIIKEERKENGGSDLAIKIMDGVVDARELGIQYVIDKLKAQKGEKV